MSRQVIVQLRVAVNAFVDRDPSWAAALADMDDTTDELERRLFRHVLERDGGSPVRDAPIDEAHLNAAVQLALVARHYERIGDHAVTIAEQVHFVATGDHTARGSADDGLAADASAVPGASAMHPRRAGGRMQEGGGGFPGASADDTRALGERGAGKGGFPGPALSVRLFAGHALPTVKSQIPELLSEGGSGSRSRLTVTSTVAGFRRRCLNVAGA